MTGTCTLAQLLFLVTRASKSASLQDSASREEICAAVALLNGAQRAPVLA